MRRDKRRSEYHSKDLNRSLDHNYISLKSNLPNSQSTSIELQKKIGVTRMSESMLFNSNQINKITKTKQYHNNKKQVYSLSKLNKENINSPDYLRLPSLKKPSTPFTNPEEKFSFSLKSSPHKKPTQKQSNVYYQSLISKSLQEQQNNYMVLLGRQHFLQTIQALKIGKFIKLQLPNKQIKLSKKNPNLKTVFLDLDQTLIHCDENSNSYTVKLQFPIQGGSKISAGIRVRPFCMQFLEEVSKFAEIIIFTASNQSYADVVLNYLDPHKKIFSHRLYRQHCTLQKGYYIKDLRVVNRRLQDCVLVDNSGYCFMLQPFNGIPILPYYHYGKDKQLLGLIPFLKEVLQADDVRVPVKNTFFWNKYLENDNEPKKIFEQNFQQQ